MLYIPVRSLWILAGIVAAIGVFFLTVTYLTLYQAHKKKDTGEYTPSGVPCAGGICLILAGLISPCKWLALLGLLDYGLWVIPYILLIEPIIRRREKKQEAAHGASDQSKEEEHHHEAP